MILKLTLFAGFAALMGALATYGAPAAIGSILTFAVLNVGYRIDHGRWWGFTAPPVDPRRFPRRRRTVSG